MTRMKLIPRRTVAHVIIPQQWARRFCTYYRHPDATFGEYLVGFLALWEEAKDYVTDFEASHCLINQVPEGWTVWAETQMRELVFKDSITGASRCHILKLVQRLFDQWTGHGNPPKSGHQKPDMSNGESSDSVCSNGNISSGMQPRNNDMEVRFPTKIPLPRVETADEVVEVPKMDEVATKTAHDRANCALYPQACVLLIQEGDKPAED